MDDKQRLSFELVNGLLCELETGNTHSTAWLRSSSKKKWQDVIQECGLYRALHDERRHSPSCLVRQAARFVKSAHDDGLRCAPEHATKRALTRRPGESGCWRRWETVGCPRWPRKSRRFSVMLGKLGRRTRQESAWSGT